MRRLASLPEPGETFAQWSSFDRSSKYDAKTRQYIDWSANNDQRGFIREEGDKLVLAEMKGPGCIWRIWTAAPQDGRVSIYLDGAAKPVIDRPFLQLFNAKVSPFKFPYLVYRTLAGGFNNYVPICYSKSCKIVADKEWGMYFHFGYGSFPPGTKVPTFTGEFTAQEQAALTSASKQLSRPGPPGEGTRVIRRRVSIPSEGKSIAALLEGSGAMVQLVIKPTGIPKAEMQTALRQLTLQIKWDGESEPGVWSPLGDFFGSGPGVNPYESFAMNMDHGELNSRWYMPYARGALLEIANDGLVPRVLEVAITVEPMAQSVAAGLARFHAKWHRGAPKPRDPGRARDWTVLKTSGRGRFVGAVLNIWNPRGSWWGEGDEKFFVDGEKFPSTFGTGTEDYFGYGWSSPIRFSFPYHGQSRNDGNNLNHISLHRWHITDNVPFQESFEAALGKDFDDDNPTQYDCVAYWYLAPGGEDPYQASPLDQRQGFYKRLPAVRQDGGLEAEFLTRLEGGATPIEMAFCGPGTWSNDMQLLWDAEWPGAKLVLAIPVKKDGRYRLSTVLTRARGYGIVQLFIGEKRLGSPADLSSDRVQPFPMPPLDLGVMHLARGTHRLTVKMLRHPRSKRHGYIFGMDWFKLDPVK